MMRRRTLAEQCAAELELGIRSGRWPECFPGVDRLAADFGVSRETMRAALQIVERLGLLTRQGSGKARVVASGGGTRRNLRFGILLHDSLTVETGTTQVLIMKIRQAIEQAGHSCAFSPKCQVDLGLKVNRIARHIEGQQADAWLVASGSIELLGWFAARPQPVLALGGRTDVVPIAGISRDAVSVFREVFREMITAGHRRITMICPKERRSNPPGQSLVILAEELAAAGVPFGPYNAPEWEETPTGLQAMLASLFQLTPPTLLQVTSAEWMAGVLAFLAQRGLRVPEDVSLICENMDNNLAWHDPKIAYFDYDSDGLVRQVMRWVHAVGNGTQDRRVATFPTTFVRGGSIRTSGL